MKLRSDYNCPLEMTHDITIGKWKPTILWQMGKQSTVSFTDLFRKVNGISEKVLTEHLSELCEFELIDKKAFDGYPLKVEYALTERGRKMLEAIAIMQEIGIDFMLEDGRADFLKSLGLV